MVRKPRLVLAAIAATAAAAFTAAPANAGLLVQSATECDAQSTSRVFAPWLDFANYFLAPDGGFENGAEGWALDGASVVDGNESYNVTGPGASSLSVPSGASATSPSICVGVDRPSVRFFVKKNGGGLLSSLRVDALVEDNLGLIRSLPVGVVGGTGSWNPSSQMIVLASLLPLLPGSHTPVEFRFTAQGGSWQVDDVHVDPYSTR
jgi:hypothetical protein